MRLGEALAGPHRQFELRGLADRNLPSALDAWTASATSFADNGRPLVGFRLEEPFPNIDKWRVSYHLHTIAGEERVSISALKAGRPDALDVASSMVGPEDTLLDALARPNKPRNELDVVDRSAQVRHSDQFRHAVHLK